MQPLSTMDSRPGTHHLARFVASCCACWLLFQMPLNANDSSQWTYFRMADGLPSAGDAGVTISPRDRVWIRHHDANTITELTGYDISSQAIPEGSANRVYESRSAQLWTVHARGINLWSKNAWKSFNIQAIATAYKRVVSRLDNPVSLIPLQINQCLILANDGIHLFNAVNSQAQKIIDLQRDGMREFTEMIELTNGDVMIAGRGGLIRIKGPAKEIKNTPATIIQLPDSIKDYKLSSPLENPGNVYTFIGEADDKPRLALRLENGEWSWVDLEDFNLRTYWEDDSGNGWGTKFNGLYQIEAHSKKIIPSDAVEASLFYDVVTDGKGSAWLATSEGLVRQSPAYWKTIMPKLGEAAVFDMTGDDQNGLWMITESDLVHVDDTGQLVSIPWPRQMESIFTPGRGLFLLENGKVALNVGESPLVYDPEINQFMEIQATNSEISIQRIMTKQKSNSLLVWAKNASSENPLFWNYSEGTIQAAEIPLPSNSGGMDYLWASELVDSKEMWFGTNEGIAYTKGNQWIQFEPEDGLGFHSPSCLVELQDGRLWLGAGSSIYELKSNRWESVYVTYEKINDMLEAQDGTVWVATNNGVHRYLKEEIWLSHNTPEGLPSNTIYKLNEDVNGVIRAATTRGVCQYNPQSDRDAPITLITMDEVDGNRVMRSGSVIHFEGLDKWKHTAPSRLLFSYRQDNEPWKPFSHTNQIVLGDLPAGPHQVEVRAIDRNGNIESAPPVERFDFIIPWHEDPRLMGMTIGAIVVTVLLAGLAVNRHLQLKQSYAEVERIVALRTQELERANHELLQDQKMKALGTLASGIAHDFNSILSIIKGSVQIIESNSNDTEKIKKRVNRIHAVIDQGAGIVRSMLGYVRRKNEPSQPHDLNRITHEAIQLAEENASDLRIEFLDQPGIGKVNIVPDLLRQIMINLINNAMDSMEPEGCILVRLESGNEMSGHVALKPKRSAPFAIIRIQDSGVGISQEIIPRIFEPFYTTKAFSSRRGTGLGLSMVYEMAREMGAGLSVESSPGKGSLFSIYIPLLEERSSFSGVDKADGEDLRTK